MGRKGSFMAEYRATSKALVQIHSSGEAALDFIGSYERGGGQEFTTRSGVFG
jgi:hypothetical protein